MKINRKIIYSLGLLGIAIPAATIISCGESSDSERQESDQKKLNEITSNQVIESLKINGNDDKYAESTNPVDSQMNITINKLSGVIIQVNDDWKGNDEKGEITFSVTARKSGLKDHVINVKAENYNKDKAKLINITREQIIGEFTFNPSITELPSNVIPTITTRLKTDVTINGLDHVDIALTNFEAKDDAGGISFIATLKTDLLRQFDLPITVIGYKTISMAAEEKKFQALTADEVLKAMDFKADPNKWSYDTSAAPAAQYDDKTIEGISGDINNIDISTTMTSSESLKPLLKWQGEATFDIELTDPLGFTKTITDVAIDGFMVEVNTINVDDSVAKDNNLITVVDSGHNSRDNVTFSNAVTKIDDNAFVNKRIDTLTFEPNSNLIAIGNSVVHNDAGHNISFPNSLMSIGNHTFEYANFSSITFGNKLKTIGEKAFTANTSYSKVLKSLTIPDSVESIGKEAFGNISTLAPLTFRGDSTSTKLILDEKAFKLTPISAVDGTEWQAWANLPAQRVAFKT